VEIVGDELTIFSVISDIAVADGVWSIFCFSAASGALLSCEHCHATELLHFFIHPLSKLVLLV
jgi:hypothetical protein